MNINLKEIMEQLRQAENRGKQQKPEISVTIKAEGEEDVTYKENFLVMHIGEGYGAVVGCLGAVELIRAVDMLMDSVTEVIERMPPHEQMMMSMMLRSDSSMDDCNRNQKC
ncbi:MAG: hypothetical protein WBK03_07015 [Dethiobacteria bacterium]